MTRRNAVLVGAAYGLAVGWVLAALGWGGVLIILAWQVVVAGLVGADAIAQREAQA